MKKLFLSLSLVVSLLAAAQVAAPVAAVPIELRRVNGTNYNVASIRAHYAAFHRWAENHRQGKEPVRPLPEWDLRSGQIRQVSGQYLLVEFHSKWVGYDKADRFLCAIRNVPHEKQRGRQFNDFVMRTEDAFQSLGERWPVYDFGTPVAAPVEPPSAAVARAEAAAKAAAAKKAALDAAVAKFRAEQSAAK